MDDILKQGGKSKKKGASAADALKNASATQQQDIHTLNEEEIGKKLELGEEKPWIKVGSGYRGLSTKFAEERLDKDGPNELTEK